MSFLLYLAGGALVGALVRWWRPRPGWGWIAGYWLLAGAFFAAPLTTTALQVPTDIVYRFRPWRARVDAPVRPANDLLGDVPLEFLPNRALVRDRLLRFEAPLWAGELGTGQPLLGNAQSAPFSPLALLTLPLPPVRALPVTAALKLFLSLLLTDALLAALGAGRAGAAFAALAFGFSVFSTCWAYHPHGMASAWLPGVMLGLVLLRRGERGGLAGLAACATGMALSGHPETLAHTALAAGVVALVLLWAGGGAPRKRYLVGLTVAAAIAAGLTAPVLLPVVEALPEAARAEVVRRSPEEVQPPPFAAPTLRVLVDPVVYGSPRDGDWNGPWNWNELCSGYAGLLALALALAAALTLRGRVLAILAGGAAALAAAFAIPPFLGLVRALPLLGAAANGRLRLFWVLAVAVAAGLGLEPLAARRDGRFLAAACTAAAALALALGRPPQAPWQLAWWLATLATCGLTALAFLWLALRPSTTKERFARGLPWLALAALALDLGLLNGRFLPVLPARFDLAPPPAVAMLTGELAAHPSAPFRVMGVGLDLTPNLASFYGLWDPRADDPMQPARAARVVGRALRPGFEVGDPIYMPPRPPYPDELLSYLGVRYLLTRKGEALGPPWERAWSGPGGELWRNPAALPLFFLPRPQAGSARFRQTTSNGFEIATDTPAGGLVASSVAWSPAWRLAVDGVPAPLLRVNAGFLGFRVPAGAHRAVLDYRPAGWVWGLRLAGLTSVALLAFGALPAARRRSAAPQPTRS
ncbi:MAG: hypothetical protein QOJ16_2276 [Acidobacteriota bacterium]|jgi:hypothetical protein|nr:hypothetical protein [Acidobacteriota bacterium]